MHIKTIEGEQHPMLRSHFRKKILASLILALISIAGLATWAIVQAVTVPTGIGSQIAISKKQGVGGIDGYRIFYGVNPSQSNDGPWNTYWYTIKNTDNVTHDAVCIEPNKESPANGNVSTLDNDTMKRALLVTIESYSSSSTGSPVNFYSTFKNDSYWKSYADRIRNFTSHHSGSASYDYNNHPTAREIKYTFGHILASYAYNHNSYALSTSEKESVVDPILNDINSWFSANNGYYNSYLNDFRLYAAKPTDTSDQTVAWLEYSRVNAKIKIKKLDADTNAVTNGPLTVQGTIFSVLNSSNVEVATITIGSNGTGTVSNLDAGTYTIKEKTASTGYNENTVAIKVTITRDDDGKTIDLTQSTTTCANNATFTISSTGCTFKNTPIKGWILFAKTGYELSSTGSVINNHYLKNVQFKIVNQRDSSIEYTIATDQNGGWQSPTNLIYGTYKATELRSEENKIYKLLEFTFKIENNGDNSSTIEVVNGTGTKSGAKLRDDIPEIVALSTVARNSRSSVSSPDKEIEISASAGVTDHITCSGLETGTEYKIEGTLWDKASSAQVKKSSTDETFIAGLNTFVADAGGKCNGSTGLDMVFPEFDSSAYINKILGIKQELYKNAGTSSEPVWVRIFVHNATLNDANEEVKVKNIQISTVAKSERSINDKELTAGVVKIIDTYSIIGLVGGSTYNLKGYVKHGDTTVATATNTINMSQGTGTEYSGSMTFELDSTPYVGEDLTVVQELYLSSQDTPIAIHSTDDGSETVHVITPTVSTHAVNARDGSDYLEVGHIDESGSPTIKDTVTYSGLTPGTVYRVSGLISRLDDTNFPDIANVATATKSFTASSEDGSIDLTFEVDTIQYCSKNNKLTLPCRFLVTERIFYGDDSTVPFVYHFDPDDEEQTVHVASPTIATNATDIKNNSKELPVGTTSVLDEVIYDNLMPGQNYILKGKLVDLTTGNVVTNSNGEEVTAMETFTAVSNSAAIYVDSFKSFDTVLDYDYSLGDNQKKYVVYQTLYSGDIELYSHADSSEDSNQIVQIGVPKLATSATYKTDGTHLLGVGDVTMKDYVDYEGLVEGEWYMIVGTMVDPDTNEPLEINDEFVRNTKTFKAGTNGKGTVELEINLNTLSIQGRKFVVYERLYRSSDKHGDGRLLAIHEPALDEDDQTITVKKASIGTTASDKADGDNVLAHESGQTILDKIHYDGLLMDETYTLYGYLYNKTTHEPVKDSTGKLITATTTFTTPAKSDNGDVEMEFAIDAHSLPGVEIVVFEYLFHGNSVPTNQDGTVDFSQIIAKHADEDNPDPSQTVKVSMRIGTTAADMYDGDQIVGVGRVSVIDKLKYEGAIMGKTYKAKGWLVYKTDGNGHKAGDKVKATIIPRDCAYMDISQEEYEACMERTHGEETWDYTESEETFIIGTEGFENTSGLVSIIFNFNSRKLIGEQLVVFEELYLVGEDGEELVAEHKNLSDDSQTITVAVPTIHTIAVDKSDRDKELANNADVIILDTVEYTGLVAGDTYTLHGVLVDKSSGERISGGVTEAVWTFRAKRDSGTEDIEFAINTTGLGGKEIVAFETLYIDDEVNETNKIAEHKDLNDDSQTVWVKVNRPNTGILTHSIEEARMATLYTAVGGVTVLVIGGWVAFRIAKHRSMRNF